MAPLPLPGFKTGHGNGTKTQPDSFDCAYCEQETLATHAVALWQSNFKGKPPSFLDEIDRELRAVLENARHVVLFGYSLPTDDVEYRSILSARKRRAPSKTFCSVVVGHQGEDRWLDGDEAAHAIKSGSAKENQDTVQAAIDIFGKDSVRFYNGGIPKVFTGGGDTPDIARVTTLLYPKEMWRTNN